MKIHFYPLRTFSLFSLWSFLSTSLFFRKKERKESVSGSPLFPLFCSSIICSYSWTCFSRERVLSVKGYAKRQGKRLRRGLRTRRRDEIGERHKTHTCSERSGRKIIPSEGKISSVSYSLFSRSLSSFCPEKSPLLASVCQAVLPCNHLGSSRVPGGLLPADCAMSSKLLLFLSRPELIGPSIGGIIHANMSVHRFSDPSILCCLTKDRTRRERNVLVFLLQIHVFTHSLEYNRRRDRMEGLRWTQQQRQERNPTTQTKKEERREWIKWKE